MNTQKFEGEISSVYGNEIKPSLVFEGTFEAFGPDKSVKQYSKEDWQAAYDEIVAAKELPDTSDVVNFVNNLRKANARQKAMQAKIDAAGYKKPELKTDVQLQLKQLYKVFIVQPDATEESARALAEAAIGAKFSD